MSPRVSSPAGLVPRGCSFVRTGTFPPCCAIPCRNGPSALRGYLCPAMKRSVSSPCRSAAPGTRARRSTSGAGRIRRFQRSCLGSTPAPRPRLDARRPDRVRPRGTTHLLAQITVAFAAGGRPSAGTTGEEMGRRGSVPPRHVPAAQTGRQARVRDRCLDRARPIHVLATAGVAPVRHRAPHVAILPAETADPRGRSGPGRRPRHRIPDLVIEVEVNPHHPHPRQCFSRRPHCAHRRRLPISIGTFPGVARKSLRLCRSRSRRRSRCRRRT